MKRFVIALGTLLFVGLHSPVFANTTPRLTWSTAAVSMAVNESSSAQITLSTAGQSTTGADALITFDPTSIEITGVTFHGLFQQNTHAIAQSQGQLRLTGTMIEINRSYTGSDVWATVSWRAKQAGSQSTLAFTCMSGATNDTNIIAFTSGQDIIDCGALGSVSVTTAATTQPTASPAPTNPAATATPSPSPSPTVTPSPTPTTSDSCANPGDPYYFMATPQGSDSVLLSWRKPINTHHFSIQYGTKEGVYTYGVSNVGSGDLFLVNYLIPNTTYYFAVNAVNDCGETSNLVTASARTNSRGGGTVTSTTPPVRTGTSATPSPTLMPSLATLGTTTEVQSSPIPTSSPIATTNPTETSSGLPGFLLPLIGILLVSFVIVAVGVVYLRSRMSQTTPPSTEVVEQPPTPPTPEVPAQDPPQEPQPPTQNLS